MNPIEIIKKYGLYAAIILVAIVFLKIFLFWSLINTNLRWI